MLQKVLRESGVTDLVRIHNNSPAPVQEAPVEQPQTRAGYAWGGRLNLIPEIFSLPTGILLLAWQHWCLGINRKDTLN
jgi:hypothetical protein